MPSAEGAAGVVGYEDAGGRREEGAGRKTKGGREEGGRRRGQTEEDEDEDEDWECPLLAAKNNRKPAPRALCASRIGTVGRPFTRRHTASPGSLQGGVELCRATVSDLPRTCRTP